MNAPYIDSWLHLPKGEYNLRQLKQRLEVVERQYQAVPESTPPTVYHLWKDTEFGLAIPRQAGFLRRDLIMSAVNCTIEGDDRDFGDPIALRAYQTPLVDSAIDSINGHTPYGGLLCAKPGFGKTVMGLETVRRIGKTALVLVHKEFLMNQWAERIAQFLPKARVGIVQQNRCDFGDDFDIVIAMIQSLSQRQYDPAFYTWAGVVATDECLTGDSLVTTENGFRRLDSLDGYSGLVLTLNETQNIYEWKRISRFMRKGVQLIVEVRFDGGVLRCTPDHSILTNRGWVEAGELTTQDRLCAPTGGVVRSVEFCNTEEVYDIEVEDNHNFVANGVVVHNCHRVGAPTWGPVIPKFPGKVRLGLTATPRRKDGLEPVFFWHIGPIIASPEIGLPDATMAPIVKRLDYTQRYALAPFLMRNGKFNNAKWLTWLGGNYERNRMLAGMIQAALRNNRRVIALSHRLAQLDTIKAMISTALPNYTIGKYVGGMKQDKLSESAQCQLILGTYAMAAEALDIPPLDTLVMLTPQSDVEQSVGRIQRSMPNKPKPIVIDPVDVHVGYAQALAKRRGRIYRKIGAEIRA